jgi:hypothetical protein
MTKFFSKDLADNVGYGIATEIAAISVELQTDLARMAAVRKAQGLLSAYSLSSNRRRRTKPRSGK